ncbi:hypothetical protein PIN31115_03203 [Pandoraea iniqua]|uniref:Uncharacterized protein n=1 Tax=Pandoraea iniqua TaxID=2508288 RepID=A0A5E4WFE4_9BURK|nr:hypothetical protein [Pandoraea iniqua]VVE22284.1 hypothetical protein PIN31115_03203 [Pandoraea iniqua]
MKPTCSAASGAGRFSPYSNHHRPDVASVSSPTHDQPAVLRIPAPANTHGLNTDAPPDETAIHQMFAEALSSVLQSHVDLVSPRYPTVRVTPWKYDVGVWVIRFSTPEAASAEEAGASGASSRRLHLTLSHFDFAQCEVRQRHGTVPEDRALAWAGAAARQCQCAQAALERPSTSTGAVPLRWRWQSDELPQLRAEDVDAFELDLSSYLRRLVSARTPPPAPPIAPPDTPGSIYSTISEASAPAAVESAPPDAALLAWCPEGIPVFHASSPTLMRTRDVARYLFARRRFAPARHLWSELRSWGVPKSALATFLTNDMGTRKRVDEGLRERWNGRLVCLDDLVAWDAAAAQYELREARTVAASGFAKSRHIDPRQFEEMRSMIALYDVVARHAQGKPLESLDHECASLDILVIRRAASVPNTYLLRMRRARIATRESSPPMDSNV